MPLDLSAYDIDIGDTRDLVDKLNNAHRAIEAGVNATEDTVTDRLDDQDAIIDGLAGAMTAGVTFKGTHSAAGGAYPVGPANGDYWIISAAGTISGVYFNIGDSIVYYSSSWIRIPAAPDMSAINPLTKAIRVAITAAGSGSNGIQALDSANLDMGTNGFTPWVQKRISNTRPSANEILERKHDGVNGWIITLLTTGIIRLTLNGTNYDSTAALPSATNVIPLIMCPVTRETTSAAGSVTFVVDVAQLGSAVAIAAHGDLTTERISNGDFVASPGAWVNASVGTGNAVIGGGSAVITGTDSPNRGAMQQNLIGIVAGDVIEVVLTGTVTSGVWRMGATAIDTAPNGVITTGVSTARFVATGATPRIYIWNVAGAGASATFTACSVKKVASVNNTRNLYALGTSTTRTEGDYYEHGIYNRALTVAECLRHAVMGPDPADVGASQTELVTDGSFSLGDTGWTKDTGVTIADQGGGDYEAVFTSSGVNTEFYRAPVRNIELGKKYRVTYTITNYTTGSARINLAGIVGTTRSSAGTFTEEITVTSVGAQRVGIRGVSATNTFRVDDFSIIQVGIVGWWNAQDAQSNTGQIFDRSGNKGYCVLPAAGATILPRPPRTFQVRSTHSWAETHELQYLTLVNQPVVPSTAKLVRIFGEVTSTGGSGPQDFIIGDGSDGDRYVVLTSGLTTGKKEFTIDTTYAGFNDGTNLKLTIDPDANCTMTVALVLVFENLE